MDNNRMQGKICMVTGANSGIGKETAIGLAIQGATVVMVCRDAAKGEAALKEIKERSGNSSIDLLLADLSSQQAIRNLVEDFKSKYSKLHVLINNAGLVLSKRTLSVDGIETQLAVNHLAPFLLTNLLQDVLKASAPARVVNTSSGIHKRATLDDLQSEKKYSAFSAYGKSKLALTLFTYELARRLKGSGVTVNAVHPGVVKTNLGRDMDWFSRGFTKVFFTSPVKGAATSIYVASSPDVEGITGKYFAHKKETPSSKLSYDESAAKQIWDLSAKLTHLST
ncbi:MAG: SDR family oxidoreductase [Candidatus Helarchaeota archaeon]|nr:SDR family oxidoreductase [Candidatus Helarchaeota archaeon]